MVKAKRVVCFCLDVTENDIMQSIREGFYDVETLKRYTGVTTGPCQGKLCLAWFVRIISKQLGRKPEEVGLPTARPPVKPIPLGVLAGQGYEE